MRKKTHWPKNPTRWIQSRILHISIPFTWNLPDVKEEVRQRSMLWDSILVGGPAVYLMPGYFDDIKYVKVGRHYPGVLQKVNPQATKTTSGCPGTCSFCGVPKFEGQFQELEDWPSLPIVCDNNLLAATREHFDRVVDRLKGLEGVDFNQGLDSRRLTEHHAQRLAEIPGATIRLSYDSARYKDKFDRAIDFLLSAGIPKRRIRIYALVGKTDVKESVSRCEYIERKGIKVLPMNYKIKINPVLPLHFTYILISSFAIALHLPATPWPTTTLAIAVAVCFIWIKRIDIYLQEEK